MRLKVFISKETDDGWRQDLFHVVMERDDAALRIHAGAGDEDVRRVMRGLRDTAEQWLEDEKVLPGRPTDAPSGPVQKTPRKRRVENPDEGEARPFDTTSDISGGQRPRSKRKYF